jgi:O-antigen/teichoic acid export membrane protein
VGVATLSVDPQAPVASHLDGADVLDSRRAGSLIIRGGALRFGGYIAMIALSVLSAALLTRHLGVVRFGQYTTVISLVTIVASVTDAGMSNLGVREFAVREGLQRDALMRDLLGLRVVLTLVGTAFATAFALAAGYRPALLAGTILASLGTVALVLQHTFSIPLGAALRLGWLSGLEVARQTVTVGLLILVIVLHGGLLPLLAVGLVANALMILPTAALVRGRIALGVALRPRRWGRLLRLTVAFSLATAVGTVYIYTAQILTSLLASGHQSGLFAASFRVFVVVAGVPGLLVSGALPLLARSARDDRERLSYALQRIFEVSLILGVGAALVMLGGARFIIDVVAGARFAEAVPVLRVQSLATVASFLVAGWSFALLSLERYRQLLVVNAGAFAVSCALTAALAPAYGAKGAAWATVCGEATLAAGALLALVRGHPELRPGSAIVVKVALAAVPATVIALLLTTTSLVRALLAFAAYALIIVLTRAVPREAVELLPIRRG